MLWKLREKGSEREREKESFPFETGREKARFSLTRDKALQKCAAVCISQPPKHTERGIYWQQKKLEAD